MAGPSAARSAAVATTTPPITADDNDQQEEQQPKLQLFNLNNAFGIGSSKSVEPTPPVASTVKSQHPTAQPKLPQQKVQPPPPAVKIHSTLPNKPSTVTKSTISSCAPVTTTISKPVSQTQIAQSVKAKPSVLSKATTTATNSTTTPAVSSSLSHPSIRAPLSTTINKSTANLHTKPKAGGQAQSSIRSKVPLNITTKPKGPIFGDVAVEEAGKRGHDLYSDRVKMKRAPFVTTPDLSREQHVFIGFLPK
jgi:outer membrane biosynthesis protein TonB